MSYHKSPELCILYMYVMEREVITNYIPSETLCGNCSHVKYKLFN